MKRALTYTRGAGRVTACVWGLANAAPPEALYQDRVTVIEPHIMAEERSRAMTCHKINYIS